MIVPYSEFAQTLLANPDAKVSRRDLPSILESILFVGVKPLVVSEFVAAFGDIGASDVRSCLRHLAQEYRAQKRPYEIIQNEMGYFLQLAPSYQSLIRNRTRSERAAKLPRPAVEVLSVIAYKQPISRSGIEAVIKDSAGSILRQLTRRGLIEMRGDPDNLKANSWYVTTDRFLEVYGLESLEDLPTIDESLG